MQKLIVFNHVSLDGYFVEMVVNPIVLGQGRTMFEDVEENLALRLTKMRAFGNGNVLLCYEPKK